uniref:RNA-directed RNA polymerase N-terminal domain-containing protein n=1 Tax=Shenzhen reo-like virus 1 TaxID=2789623 RepID=A0A7T1GW15_9REOV|nr:hypothetical protein [Shenzhen reo-like virus 1]
MQKTHFEWQIESLKSVIQYIKLNSSVLPNDYNGLDLISKQYFSMYGLVDKKGLEVMNPLFSIFKMSPEILLYYAKSYPLPDESIMKAVDDNLLWNPSPTIVDFNYDPELKRTLECDLRYLINQRLDKFDENDINHQINKKLFENLAFQGRWAGFWTELASLLFHVDTISESNALKNVDFFTKTDTFRVASDLQTVRTVMYIVKRWNQFPFYHRKKQFVISSKYGSTATTCIVPLLYSLMELSKEEKMFNNVQDLLVQTICERVTYAYVSFESIALKNKSKYSKLLKQVTKSLTSSVKVTYSDGVESAITVKNYPEIFFECEADSAITEEDIPSYLKSYIKKLGTIKDSDVQSETARWLLMWLISAGNPGIYFRTSLLLEYEKSVGPQIHETPIVPRMIDYVQEGVLRFNVAMSTERCAPELKYVIDTFNEWLDKSLNVLVNCEEHFVSILTSNSQGIKVDPKSIVVNNLPDVIQNITSVKQKRIAGFTYDREPYEQYSSFITELLTNGKCAIRFQNNRRARIVEIVPNVDQTAWQLILMIFEALKEKDERIAVGKQQGSIIDMKVQMYATGQLNTVSLFSDISGADASVQPFIGTLFALLLAQKIVANNYGDSKYFSCSSKKFVSPTTGKVWDIPALAVCLLTVIATRDQKNYILRDPITSVDLKIKPAIFESGRYDTSAQHTMMFTLLHQKSYSEYLSDYSDKPQWQVKAYKFGDDSLEIAKSNFQVMDFKSLEKYQLQSIKDMKGLGFKMEAAVSTYISDFLQQMAFNGRVVPKSARSSIYCDERQDTANRDVLDRLDVVANVITAAAQRGYAPENIITNIWVIWSLIRHIKWHDTPGKLAGRFKDLYNDSIKLFSYPFTLMFFPPYNVPNPNLLFEDIYLPRSSFLRTVGNSKLVWMINKIVTDIEWKALCKLPVENPISLYLLVQPRLESLGVLSAMIIHAYQRNQKLSKERSKMLQSEIEQMADILGEYQNPYRKQTSLYAVKGLKELGLEVPESITYYYQPIARIKDMFSSVLESDVDATRLTSNFFYHMNRFCEKVPLDIKKSISIAGVFFGFDENREIPGYQIYSKFPVLPGYRLNGEYDRALRVLGSPLIDDPKTSKFLSSMSKYGNSFPIETAIHYGMKALHIGHDALLLYMDAVGIPENYREQFEQLLLSQETVPLQQFYTSGFNKSEMFGISGNAQNLTDLISLPGWYPGSMLQSTTIILRDFILYNLPYQRMNAYVCAYSNDSMQIVAHTFLKRYNKSIKQDIE